MRGFLYLLGFTICLCLFGQAFAESQGSRFILSAVEEAKRTVDEAYKYSREMCLERVRRNTASAANRLQLLKQPFGFTRSAVRSADYMENALRIIREKAHNVRNRRSLNATDFLTPEDVNKIAELTGCQARIQPPSCRTTPLINKYRTATSVCNNKKNTRFGSSNTPFTRWLPAQYQDDVSLPVGWDRTLPVNGKLLPLVREVSNNILKSANEQVASDDIYTHLITIFGQWTDHDLTFTPHSPSIRSFSNGINCEDSCERTEPCFPIPLPDGDPRRTYEHPCMPFSRSAPTCGTGNTGFFFGASNTRQQINALTAFLDLGQVYGPTDILARDLRDLTNDGGLMRVNDRFTDNGRELLPSSTAPVNACATRKEIERDPNAEEVPCFLAGDVRADENIALTSLHTLMLREHNRLARALRQLNPKWSSETLYQEARKITGAYAQVITYRDYLPAIVGPDFMTRYLSTYPGYDENVDPSISNIFATAAYRFGHAAVQPTIFRLDGNYNEHPHYRNVMLHRAFFAPWRIVFEGGVDPILRGLIGRKAKLNVQDGVMNEELRNRLFEFTSKLALDLGSLNLQRGRDHGLPGYNEWRGFCGLSQPQTEQELAEVLNNADLARELMKLYGTPSNIDAWLGGITEPFVPGGRVGPLFACIIARQFQRIRQGDRLWWQNEGIFTYEQQASLTNTYLSRIICDNTGITDVPMNPFLFRARGPGYTRCEDIPPFDLSPWQEKPASHDSMYGTHGPPGPKDPSHDSMYGTHGPPGPKDPSHDSMYATHGPPGPKGDHGPSGPPGYSTTQHSAFAMRLGYTYPTPGAVMVFHEVIYNEQGHYSTETGLFTCEFPGVYQLDFHLTLYQNIGNVDLMRNGKLVIHSFTSRQNGYFGASGGTIVRLEKGDKVWLEAKHGGNAISSDSFFSGHLLY